MGDTEETVFKFNAKFIAYAHGICATTAFLGALAVGYSLHYEKIITNASYGWPDEWFPSVSATIGDRYPERSVFQILIAVAAGPRFLLLAFNCLHFYNKNRVLLYSGIASGFIRTFTCGGWVYITSTDDHDVHDIFMISYIVLTLPWTVCTTLLSEPNTGVRRGRTYSALAFFGMIIPLIYWFIQHKVHVRPGAYSIYAYFEWSLVLLDIAFDQWSVYDFEKYEVVILKNGVSYQATASKKSSGASMNNSIEPAKEEVTENDEKASKSNDGKIIKKDDFPSQGGVTFLKLIVNSMNAFVFWVVTTCLPLCIWYFPLWDMGISGYEALIFVQPVSPLFLAIPSLRKFFGLYPSVLRLLTVIFGIGAYLISTPKCKLVSVAIGSIFGAISVVNEVLLAAHDIEEVALCGASMMIGLFGFSITKYLCYSNNPFWAVMKRENGGYNEIGIFFGVIAAYFTRTEGKKLQNHNFFELKGSRTLAALALGSIFFTLQFFLTDSGTLVLWTWTGFPIKGPTLVTGAVFHFSAFFLGVIFSLKLENITANLFYNVVIGGGGAFTLLYCDNWIGYAGACLYVFYVSSVVPIVIFSILGHNLIAIFSFAFLVQTFFALGSTWVVAYAFVPGGWILRERSDLILGLSFLLIFMGVINYRKRKSVDSFSAFSGFSNILKWILVIGTILMTIATLAYFSMSSAEIIEPFNFDSGTFTTGIWCVHFGLDNDMWASDMRIMELIKDAQIDVIGLLETDTHRLVGGNRDFTQIISEELGMYVDYGPGPHKHTWGAALLSRFPIINSTHHLLPSPLGELAPAIHATLDIYGEEIDVIVLHSGQEDDEEDRRLQSLYMEDLMLKSPRPLILLGYLVTDPLEGNYNHYVSEKSRMHDIDSTDWDRWCEYILFRNVRKLAYARISRSTITDTEVQIAKFRKLTNREKRINNETALYGNNYIAESDVKKGVRLPHLFKDQGIRGHRYHVFDEPRYFG